MKRKFLIPIITITLIGIGFTYRHFQTAHEEIKTLPLTQTSDPADTTKIHQFNNIGDYEKISRYGKLPDVFKGTNYFLRLSKWL